MSLRHGTLALVGLLAGGVISGGSAWAQVESPLAPSAPGALPPPPPPTSPAAEAPPPPELPPPPEAMPQGAQAAPPVGPDQGAPPAQDYPIPPNVQGAAIPVQGGGYCFGGPHPAPGGGWEATATPHVHDYAPFDLRLFSYRDGCYYFVGDPHDFGYTGQLYSYYGAHPIADSYGGGWCFMVGPHNHWWRPWSSYFTVVGPWYYWNGPYDPVFWAYWPFYSFYYRSYYPHYYAGGRYFRGGFRVAPPIGRVPASVGAGWRGGPGVAGGWRAPAATPYRGGAPNYHAAPINRGGYGGGWHGGAVPYAAPRIGGGGSWHGGGGFHSGGGFHGRH